MLHSVPSPASAFVGARGDDDAVADRCVQSLRAMHALMLAYAAQRRRAADSPVDAHYWKAAERHALDKAEAIRREFEFPKLP
jgi:hypothetical protein